MRDSAVPVATTRLDLSRELTASCRTVTAPAAATPFRSCGARFLGGLPQRPQLDDEGLDSLAICGGVGVVDSHLGAAGDEPVELGLAATQCGRGLLGLAL